MRRLQRLRIGRIRWGGIALATLRLVALVAPCQGALSEVREPIEPLPRSVPTDPARVGLGERLFHDVRLSGNKSLSCASCHPLDRNGMDGQPRAHGPDEQRPLRNTQTIFNVRFSPFLNWVGRYETLEDITGFVLTSPTLMGSSWPDILRTLKADPAYAATFAATYPQGISEQSVLDALASFQRSLITPNSRFDRYLNGDAGALTAGEWGGYQLFKSYGCVACHQGINVGGNLFQKFGVFSHLVPTRYAPDHADQGRFLFTADDLDREVFRVPSLRNVAVTAPYFHDGRAPTLEDAVDTMARAQLGRTLSAAEIHLIVQFLGSLTGEFRGQPLRARDARTP